jgi:hypothetical protein
MFWIFWETDKPYRNGTFIFAIGILMMESAAGSLNRESVRRVG